MYITIETLFKQGLNKTEISRITIPNKLENAMFSVIRNYHLFGHLIHTQY